jgi:protein SCO1/2
MKLWIAILALGLLFAAPSQAATPAKPLPGNSVYLLNATLSDAAGKSVAWQQMRGRPRIATMFYSSCPFMCPLIIESGKGIDKSLTPAERSKLGFVMVSLDPKRDTPQALTALAKKRGIDLHRWTLLRPEPRDVRRLAGILDVRYRALANGEFNHTSVLILLDAEGRILARTESIGPTPDPDFLKAVRKALGPAR